MTAIVIRPEKPCDVDAIFEVTKAAFRDMAFSDGSEPALVNTLRDDGDLTLSLVAENAERIVGHIAFSPVTIDDGSPGWHGPGPVSVLPELQGQRIGHALVKRGIADMWKRGSRGIVLLGDPAYYSRFGFEHDPNLVYPGPPAQYSQRLVLHGDAPRGRVRYAPAFG